MWQTAKRHLTWSCTTIWPMLAPSVVRTMESPIAVYITETNYFRTAVVILENGHHPQIKIPQNMRSFYNHSRPSLSDWNIWCRQRFANNVKTKCSTCLMVINLMIYACCFQNLCLFNSLYVCHTHIEAKTTVVYSIEMKFFEICCYTYSLKGSKSRQQNYLCWKKFN